MEMLVFTSFLLTFNGYFPLRHIYIGKRIICY